MTADRASYVAGLRALADLLEQHDELPLPDSGRTQPMTLWFHDASVAREQMATAARLLPGPFTKNTWGGGSGAEYFDLQGHVEGLRVELTAMREAVCTRVVTGTREVVEEVPDPDALAAVPTVTVTRTVEDVEWDCGPILAPRTREQEMQDAASDSFLDNADPDMDAAGADDYLTDVTA